jgi:hypothetical protein
MLMHPGFIRIDHNTPSPSTVSSRSFASIDHIIMPRPMPRQRPRKRKSPKGGGKKKEIMEDVHEDALEVEGFGDDGVYDPDYDEEDDEDDEDDAAVVAEVVNSDDEEAPVESVASLPSLNSIWDSDKIEKLLDKKGGMTWKCGHCVSIFAGHNATKCLYHVCCEKGENIRPCSGTIPTEYRRMYNELMKKKKEKKGIIHSTTNHIKQRMIDSQEDIASSIPDKKRSKVGVGGLGLESQRKVNTVQPSMERYYDIPIESNNATRSVTSSSSTTAASSFSKKIPKGRHQLKLGPNMVNPELKKNLDVAVADWIHSCNLPFYLAEDQKFKHMLSLARHSPANYVPPNRRAVGGVLLTANYNHVWDQSVADLKKGAETFGLTFYGDGATIQRNPKMNLLCAGVHNPCAVLDIADCSGHMSRGGKKDAAYIARLFLPIMRKLDPEKCLGDLLFFDGASNVQKAAEIISKHFPRCTVLHGGEHVLSLYFTDIFHLEQFKLLIKFHARVSVSDERYLSFSWTSFIFAHISFIVLS